MKRGSHTPTELAVIDSVSAYYSALGLGEAFAVAGTALGLHPESVRRIYYRAARLTSDQADASHNRSCACGDRAAHEAEDGSDYAVVPFEEWLPVAGFEGLYEVSDIGRVRSLDREIRNGRGRAGRILKAPIAQGYRQVGLSQNGRTSRRVHALVCRAFQGPASPGQEVRHLDGDSLNNLAENLSWGTSTENARDSRRHGTSGRNGGNKTHCHRGHLLQVPNLVVWRIEAGRKVCLACSQTYTPASRAKRRGSPWFPGMVDRQADLNYEAILDAAFVELSAS